MDFLDICPQVAALSWKLSKLSGSMTDISLGGIRTLQEAGMVNQKVIAMEATFVHKL